MSSLPTASASAAEHNVANVTDLESFVRLLDALDARIAQAAQVDRGSVLSFAVVEAFDALRELPEADRTVGHRQLQSRFADHGHRVWHPFESGRGGPTDGDPQAWAEWIGGAMVYSLAVSWGKRKNDGGEYGPPHYDRDAALEAFEVAYLAALQVEGVNPEVRRLIPGAVSPVTGLQRILEEMDRLGRIPTAPVPETVDPRPAPNASKDEPTPDSDRPEIDYEELADEIGSVYGKLIRFMKNRKGATHREILENVFDGSERTWSYMKTLINRTNNKIVDVTGYPETQAHRLYFTSDQRSYRIIKHVGFREFPA